MKELGANVVRVHFQLGQFMEGPQQPNERALEQFARLLALAEQVGLYLDVTGLGCYRKKDVPPWYDALSEPERWAVQARFWEAMAQRGAGRSVIFCYNLMNEPVVPVGQRKPGQWLGPGFAGSHFVQFITLSQAGRGRATIARQWCETLGAAVRKPDRRHLVTVGLVAWSLDRPGLTSGFVPEAIAPAVDFLCVHLYPKKDRLAEALETLSGFAVGKPVVIEEMYPLACTADELGAFMDQSRKVASGWLGFYWGKTLAEYRRENTIQSAVMRSWLELFVRRTAEATKSPASQP